MFHFSMTNSVGAVNAQKKRYLLTKLLTNAQTEVSKIYN